MAAAGTLVLLLVIVLTLTLDVREGPVASGTGMAISSSAPPTIADPSASSQPSGIFENALLGYRVTLPTTYRRSAMKLFTGPTELLGRDSYTTLAAAQEREFCLTDSGDLPSPSSGAYLFIEAYRNAARASAADWIRGRPESSLRTIEPAAVGGRDAVRLVQQRQTMAYVIGANDRLYLITPALWPSQHRLDDVAARFTPLTPSAFPAATPSEPPLDAARALAQRLAQAFAANDADAVAALMPSCKIGVGAVVGGNPTGGALNRAVVLFVPALRERFVKGDLTVTIDPAVQVRTPGGGSFVRSEWREPDRTVKIDLDLGELDGR